MTNSIPFDDQPRLQNQTVSLRGLLQSDFDELAQAASDPKIWEQHPIKDRHMPQVFAPYFKFLIDAGGTLIATDTQTGKVIGCSRYYTTPREPNSISIGYTFLIRDHWGGATNLAMKTLMLDHAFASFADVWLHIDEANLRSQNAAKKIGATYVRTEPLDIVGSKGDMMCFRLTRNAWQART